LGERFRGKRRWEKVRALLNVKSHNSESGEGKTVLYHEKDKRSKAQRGGPYDEKKEQRGGFGKKKIKRFFQR